MTTLTEIEHAVAALPREQKVALFHSLQQQLANAISSSHSVLDIPPVHLGEILKPFNNDDDLLGEMLGEEE